MSTTSEQPTNVGTNRTGIGTSPIDAKKTIEGAEQSPPSSAGDAEALNAMRADYIREAEPIGSMPPPATMKGVASTVVQMARGQKPTVLLDKLGERIAFERTGTRLYEALIGKFQVAQSAGDLDPDGPTLEQLRAFHDEELAHFEMVRDAMLELGGDPTAQTPSADVMAVASMGLLQVLSDPRTTPSQCLCALLTAELTDNDGWTNLIELAEACDQKAMAMDFRRALADEARHLEHVRKWVSASTRRQAGVAAK